MVGLVDAAHVLAVVRRTLGVALGAFDDETGVSGVFTDLGGNSHCDGAGGNDDVVEHHGVGGDDGAGVDMDAVQNNRRVTDESSVVDGAALKMHEMPDDAVVADRRRYVVSRVQHGAVLNRCASSDANRLAVASDDGGRPDRRLFTNLYAPDDDGIGVNKGAGMDDRNSIAEGVDGHGG